MTGLSLACRFESADTNSHVQDRALSLQPEVSCQRNKCRFFSLGLFLESVKRISAGRKLHPLALCLRGEKKGISLGIRCLIVSQETSLSNDKAKIRRFLIPANFPLLFLPNLLRIHRRIISSLKNTSPGIGGSIQSLLFCVEQPDQ